MPGSDDVGQAQRRSWSAKWMRTSLTSRASGRSKANHKYKLSGKNRAVKDFARTGYLGFQDHGHPVWYKNVKLLPLDP